ncbi:hypothetical protein [Thalassobius sp. Cn5-15]|uniref:hypothetical protein n=1 Tax=Thalassobius sp. Cn5-15 TaxID=2917763 RepID=UPI001EF277FB|nr:hypothetical protein [Thalassobius sp. Cn5-15]MCG7492466.1 hypothetical protein [Thalassobius sp. Cn5-15]
MRRIIPEIAGRPRQQDTPAILPVNGMDAAGWEYSLPAGTASLLDNWFIGRNNEVTIRKGWQKVGQCASNIASTLMPYELNGKSQLLCSSQGIITDALTGQRIFVHGLGSAKASYTHISNHLVVATAGKLFSYNGTTFQEEVWTGGPTATRISGVLSHNERCFFWAEDSADFWHGETGAIRGNMTLFPLSQLGSISGNIVSMASWTVDAGHGSNDVLVIMTSKGEVIAYEGIDPSDASDWRLTGRFKLPDVIPSRRAAFKHGSDLLIQTKSGVISLSSVFRSAELSAVRNFSEPVDALYVDRAYLGNYGVWVGLQDPHGKMLILNQESSDGEIHQYVKCLEAGVWVRFTGIGAVDWATFDGKMYFVTKGGTIGEFWTGEKDYLSSITAFAALGGMSREQEASVSMVHNLFSCDRQIMIEANIINGQDDTMSMSTAIIPASPSALNNLPINGRGDTLQLTITIDNGEGAVKWRKCSVRMKQARARL